MFHMLTWSLRLDYELLFKVKNLPTAGKICFILSKYALFLKYQPGGTRQLHKLMVFGNRFYYNDSKGPASLQRVYCASHTLKKHLPANPVIIDVGANIGQFNHFCRHYLGASKIISIEPVKESHDLLQRNAAVPQDCICCAVSDVEGEVLFHVAQESSQLSSYVPDENASYGETYRVRARSLDRLTSELNVGRVDLLKVDTEGSELDVLKSAERLLATTDVVLIEMSVFRKSTGNLFKIGSFLEERGFELVEFSTGGTKNPSDVDAMFKRI